MLYSFTLIFTRSGQDDGVNSFPLCSVGDHIAPGHSTGKAVDEKEERFLQTRSTQDSSSLVAQLSIKR